MEAQEEILEKIIKLIVHLMQKGDAFLRWTLSLRRNCLMCTKPTNCYWNALWLRESGCLMDLLQMMDVCAEVEKLVPYL